MPLPVEHHAPAEVTAAVRLRQRPEQHLHVFEPVAVEPAAGELGAVAASALPGVGDVDEAVLREVRVEHHVVQPALAGFRHRRGEPADGSRVQRAVRLDVAQPAGPFGDEHPSVGEERERPGMLQPVGQDGHPHRVAFCLLDGPGTGGRCARSARARQRRRDHAHAEAEDASPWAPRGAVVLALDPGFARGPLGARASRPLERRWAFGGSSITGLRPGRARCPRSRERRHMSRRSEVQSRGRPRAASILPLDPNSTKRALGRQGRGCERHDGHGLAGGRVASTHVSSVRGQPRWSPVCHESRSRLRWCEVVSRWIPTPVRPSHGAVASRPRAGSSACRGPASSHP